MMNDRITFHTSLRCLLLSFAALLTASCSQDFSDLNAFIAKTRSSHVGSVKPIPQFQPYESFSYSAGDLRDPFVPDINLEEDEQVTTSLLNPDTTRPKEALESFPLDTLRMVGILEQGDNLWGLIKDPQNVVHRVQVGNYIGQAEGRIVAIDETSISLVEIVPDGIGGYIERNASIAIGGD